MVAQSDDDHPPRLFVDLKLVAAAVLLTMLAVSLPVVRDSPIRVVITLGFVLFAPGYALIAALFPEQNISKNAQQSESSIDNLERVVLSFGASIAVVVLIGLTLNFTPWGITFVPAVVSLGGLTLGLIAVAAVQRQQVEPSIRFTVSPTLNELRNPADRSDAVMNIVIIISLLIIVLFLTFFVATPTQEEAFTELSVLTETDSGTLIADNYPSNITHGETQSLVVMVSNQEAEQVSYTLVIELQRVSVDNGEISVQEVTELHQFSPTLSDNETWRQPHNITPEMTGKNLRLRYALYRNDGAAAQTDDAYRTVHLWLNVSAPGSR